MFWWDTSVSSNHSTCWVIWIFTDTKLALMDIQHEEVVCFLIITLSSQHSCLNCCTVCNSLILIDLLIKNLTIEIFGDHFLNIWYTSWTTDQKYFMNFLLGHLRFSKAIIDRLGALLELLFTEFFKFDSRNLHEIIFIICKSITFNFSILCRWKNSLSFLTWSS